MKVTYFYCLFFLLFLTSCKKQVPDITSSYKELMTYSELENRNYIDEEQFIQISWDDSLDRYFRIDEDSVPCVKIIQKNQDFKNFLYELNDCFGIPLHCNLIKTFYVGYDGKLGINHEIFCNDIEIHYENNIKLIHEVSFYFSNNVMYLIKIDIHTF